LLGGLDTCCFFLFGAHATQDIANRVPIAKMSIRGRRTEDKNKSARLRHLLIKENLGALGVVALVEFGGEKKRFWFI